MKSFGVFFGASRTDGVDVTLSIPPAAAHALAPSTIWPVAVALALADPDADAEADAELEPEPRPAAIASALGAAPTESFENFLLCCWRCGCCCWRPSSR